MNIDRQMVRRWASVGLRATGVPSLFRRLDGSASPRILGYHDPSPAVLESHLKWYAGRFNHVSLDDVVQALSAGSFVDLPPNPLVLTFDDGLLGNYALLPLFKKYKVRPTFYVCSALADTTRHYWFNEVPNPQDYKHMSNEERLRSLRRDCGFDPAEQTSTRQALSRDELLELSEVVDIGCHTRFHPILTMLSDTKAEDEIIGAKAELERLVGRPVNHFAYPNGDYGRRERELLARAGFLSSRTVNCEVLSLEHDRFELPGIGITDNASVSMVAAQMSRLPTRVRNLVRTGQFSGKYQPIVPSAEGL